MPPLVTAKTNLDTGPKDTDIIIPVMGETKAGKSTFINRILEGAQVHPESAAKMEVAIGGDMNSCTKDIQDVIVLKTTDDALNEALGGRRLVLVDTPGFNDAKMSDQEILRRVSHWLASAYRKDKLVGGVIYLHDITQMGWTASSQTNRDLFFKLCGEEAMTQVSIVTTKWDRLPASTPDEGLQRLTQLQEVYWRDMIKCDASVRLLEPEVVPPHDKAKPEGSMAPCEMIRRIVDSMDGRSVVLQIQHEIVNQRLALGKTEAGKELRRKLKRLLEEAQATRRELNRQSRSPEDPNSPQKRIEALKEELYRLAPATTKTFAMWAKGIWESGRAAMGLK